MARIQSKLVTKQMPWHANMTDLNHLGAALIAKPEVFESTMTELFSASMYSDNSMTTVLNEMGKEQEITSNEWEWGLRTATTRPLVVVENVEPASNTTPGKFRRNFKLKLDENWYVPGDILHPGTSNKKYQVRVQEEPQRHGKGWVYEVVLMTNNGSEFLPVNFLSPGTQWAKLYSQYEEGGEQSGSTQYSLPITLSNRLSRFRKKYQVTGDAHNEVLAVKIPDSKGAMHSSWMKYAEVEYWQQWYREMERGYWYSRSTDKVLGANGRPILSGPGIQEQLEDSHIHRYTHLTATLIEEYLMDIFYSRVKPGSGRKIKAFTGEYGMIIFHRAVQDWMEKSGFIQVVDSLFIDKTSSQYHDNALVAGYQYVKYRMANGAELELIHNPLYDDRTINFEIDPVTGYPTESMRFTFMDFSGEGKKSNVKRMKKKGGMSLAYINGLVSPYGPVNNKMAAHSGDYYEMHVKDQCGIHIEDVSRCGELILNRNQQF
jgi:hypothetical protein